MKIAQYIAGQYDLRLKTFVFATNDTKNFLEDKEYICICNGNIFDKKTFVPMGVDAILKLYKEKHPSQSDGCFSWRRLRDLNPRDGYPPYALSRGASSAS